jgi:hypothetical protein
MQLEVGLQFLVGYVGEDLQYVDNLVFVFWNNVSSPNRFWCLARRGVRAHGLKRNDRNGLKRKAGNGPRAFPLILDRAPKGQGGEWDKRGRDHHLILSRTGEVLGFSQSCLRQSGGVDAIVFC